VSELGYPRRGLHGRVVDVLGRQVVAGRWGSGATLPTEDDLASELGVSRSVVRESIKVLQSKGLVEVRPKTGTRVRPRRAWQLLDADVVAWQFADMARAEDLRELGEIRATIEVAGARLAAQRRTPIQLAEIEANERRIEAAVNEPLARHVANLDFHRSIVDAAGNALLSHVNAMVRIALESVGPPAHDDVEEQRRGAAQRAAVSRAVRAGDAEASEIAMRRLMEHESDRLAKEG
jgi:DNA-binding FadR family transcriptional regulator